MQLWKRHLPTATGLLLMEMYPGWQNIILILNNLIKPLVLQERAVKIDSNNVEVYVGLARTYALKGDFEKALQYSSIHSNHRPRVEEKFKKVS